MFISLIRNQLIQKIEPLGQLLPTNQMPQRFSVDEYISLINNTDMVGLFFCGSMAVLAIFIFLVFMKNKERIYLHYGAFLFFMFIYASLYILNLLWPNTDPQTLSKIATRLVEPITIVSFGFYTLFCIELLNIQQNKRLHKHLSRWTAFNFTYAILYFILFDVIRDAHFIIYNVMRVIIFSLSVIYLTWIQRTIHSPFKHYFINGSIVYFVGSILAATRYAVDFIPFKPFYSISEVVYFETGVFIETLFFALALGDRIYVLHREKQQASQQLIEQLFINEENIHRINEDLRETVKEQMQQVNKINAQLQEEERNRMRAEYEKNLAKAEILARRMQINPHFLFNSLNAIKYLIQRQESDKAVKYLVIFSRFVRKLLDTSMKNTIPLGEEMDMIQDFLDLEKNRFGHEFNFEINIKEGKLINEVKVPPLIIQPFVENAIWHGLLTSESKQKTIKISIKEEANNTVILTINDNGIGRKNALKTSKPKLHKSLGVPLTDERINLYNQSQKSKISYEIIDNFNEEGKASGTTVAFLFEYII